ncbi:MAG: DUF2851 family protein [Ignavibacteria bacterium]|nr:DUF2851 family protein [Ignavibacteria bacterium]
MAQRRFNIHERFLRHIWSNQYLRRSDLKTTDGHAVQVINVGTLNIDGGPDFRNATIMIGAITYCGDVEIHRTAIGWLHHQHQDDPRYNKVILHVVLERTNDLVPTTVFSGRQVPVLILEPFLAESIRSLWQKAVLDERARLTESIKCFRLNRDVGPNLLKSWIRKLAVERLELKLRRFDERLRELALVAVLSVRERGRPYGTVRIQGNADDIPPPHRELTQKDLSRREIWEQVLYEGLMECLGYSKNQESFVRLARAVTLQELRRRQVHNDSLRTQAFLFGAAGLLPKIRSLREKPSKVFVRRLAKEWRELKKTYRSAILHSADWQFFPTRPFNFPTLRLAAASVLVERILAEDLFRRIIEHVKSPRELPEKLTDLYALLSLEPLEFWSNHYRFDQPTTKSVRALGAERINDMMVNTIIPLCLLYARIFRDKEVREQALTIYDSLPPAVENSITRLMNRQLLKGRMALDSVSAQQGVIQLYKFYCSEDRCLECEVGRLVFT